MVDVERGEWNIGKTSSMRECQACGRLEVISSSRFDTDPMCSKCERVAHFLRLGMAIQIQDTWRARKVEAFLTVRRAT